MIPSNFRSRIIQDDGEDIGPDTIVLKDDNKKSKTTISPKSMNNVYAGNVNLSKVKNMLGTNWTNDNVTTISQWMYIGAYKMKLLEAMIESDQYCIRANAITGIILSTLTGTLSVTALGINDPAHIYTTTTSVLFALFSFAVAIFTGYVKVYQIQERLEECIKLKQDWILFTTSITSELQLPLDVRRDALYLIISNKDAYLGLMKRDINIPTKIVTKVNENMKKSTSTTHNVNATSLPNVVLDIQESVVLAVKDTTLATVQESNQTEIIKDNINEIQIGDWIQFNKDKVATLENVEDRTAIIQNEYKGLVVGSNTFEDTYKIVYNKMNVMSDIEIDKSYICIDSFHKYEPPKFKIGDIVNAYYIEQSRFYKPVNMFRKATIVDININYVYKKESGYTYSIRFHFDILHKCDYISQNRIRPVKADVDIGKAGLYNNTELVLVRYSEFETHGYYKDWTYTTFGSDGKQYEMSSLVPLDKETTKTYKVGDYILYINKDLANEYGKDFEKKDCLCHGVIISINKDEDDIDNPKIHYHILENCVTWVETTLQGDEIIPDKTTTPYTSLFKKEAQVEYCNLNENNIWQHGIVKDIIINKECPGVSYNIQKEDNTIETIANILVRAKSH